MKLNFTVALTDLDGNIVKDSEGEPLMINKTFANLLGSNSHTETGISYMDAVTWAMAINKGEPIDLDKSEQANLKKFIETNPALTALAKKDLIAVFNLEKKLSKTA